MISKPKSMFCLTTEGQWSVSKQTSALNINKADDCLGGFFPKYEALRYYIDKDHLNA